MEQLHTLKPYLINAVYDWCCDGKTSAYIEVVNFHKNLLPKSLFSSSDQVVLDISSSSVANLKFEEEGIRFQTSMLQKTGVFFVSYHSIKRIFAKENGHGLQFSIFESMNTQNAIQDSVEKIVDKSLGNTDLKQSAASRKNDSKNGSNITNVSNINSAQSTEQSVAGAKLTLVVDNKKTS